MIMLDTNVVVAFLNGNKSILRRIRAKVDKIALNTLVIAELDYGAKASQRARENLEKLYRLVEVCQVIPFDIECKNQQKLAIWQALKQAEDNQTKPDRVPAVVFSRNHTKTYIVMEFESFLNLMYPGHSQTPSNEEPGAPVLPTVENSTDGLMVYRRLMNRDF